MASKTTDTAKKAAPKAKAETYRVPAGARWASGWKIAAAFAVIGLLGSALAASADPRRFAFSWLFAFMAGLAIALGSLFLVVIQHLTKAGWSVTVRRPLEFFAVGLPLFAILFVPVWMGMGHLYPWVELAREHALDEEMGIDEEAPAAEGAEAGEEHSAAPFWDVDAALAQDHGEHGEEHAEGHHHSREHEAHESLIEAKLSYLNPTRFTIFAIGYFVIWSLLSIFYFRTSIAQDKNRDLASSRRMNSLAPISIMALALSLTFAAFDWMMALEPAWYSTIFGVQYFAVSMVSALASLVVIMYSLRASGLTGTAVHVEHFHDVGKLLFGFLVFWTYITFSQFFLIWYAGIPEEATYYHLRGSEGWWTFSIFLLVAHFILPFFFLISRNVKRNIPWLTFGAAWLLVMHVMECYWLVMPYASENGAFDVQWMDFAALFAVLGTYLAAVLFLATRFPLIPIGDPRLQRGLHHEVV
jgi:hypothetical protein